MLLQDEVCRLANVVPREPGTSLPPGVSSSEIEGFCLVQNISIPSEVRAWLQFTDGPRIGPGGIFGLQDFKKIYSFIPEFMVRRWLPLGTDGCGGYYVLALNSWDKPLSPVYFIDPCESGGYDVPTYAVASGFWQFALVSFPRSTRRTSLAVR